MSKWGKTFLIFIGSAGLASAQVLLTGGDPSGGLTLNPADVVDALYTPVSASGVAPDPTDTTVFQGVTFSASEANITLPPAGGNQLYLVSGAVGGPDTATNAGFTNATPSTEDTNLLNLVNAGLNFSSTPLTLTIQVAPDTTYRIDSIISLLGYDGGRTDTVAYNGGPVADTITFPATDAGIHAIYDVEDEVTSNDQGTIQVTYDGSQGPFYSALVVSTVPEPSTWAMLAAGMAFLGFRIRRRNNGFTV